jgi:hypothetical protein
VGKPAVKKVAPVVSEAPSNSVAVATPVAPKEENGLSMPQAVKEVLKQEKRSMPLAEIVDLAIKRGLYKSNSATPCRSFSTALLRYGEKEGIKKVGGGVYELA